MTGCTGVDTPTMQSYNPFRGLHLKKIKKKKVGKVYKTPHLNISGRRDTKKNKKQKKILFHVLQLDQQRHFINTTLKNTLLLFFLGGNERGNWGVISLTV